MAHDSLQPYELMQKVVDFCEREGILYRIVGSMASMAYGEPRFTNDVDILIDFPMDKVDALCEAFPAPDFYIAPHAVRQAIQGRHQFNILYITAGFKVDMILPDGSEFDHLNLQQGRRLTQEGRYDALFASPENVLLKKLVYYREGGSEKHLRDIAGMISVVGETMDQAFLDEWATKLGVSEELELVRRKVRERRP